MTSFSSNPSEYSNLLDDHSFDWSVEAFDDGVYFFADKQLETYLKLTEQGQSFTIEMSNPPIDMERIYNQFVNSIDPKSEYFNSSFLAFQRSYKDRASQLSRHRLEVEVDDLKQCLSVCADMLLLSTGHPVAEQARQASINRFVQLATKNGDVK